MGWMGWRGFGPGAGLQEVVVELGVALKMEVGLQEVGEVPITGMFGETV